MITLTIGCILAGCMQDVPVIIGKDPVLYYLSQPRKQKVDKSQFSCYIEGDFYRSCPES